MEETKRRKRNRHFKGVSLETLSNEFKIPMEDIEEMISYYLCEISYKEMCERFNVNRQTLFQLFKRAGVVEERNIRHKTVLKTEKPITDKATIDYIITQYTSGKSIVVIAKKIGVSNSLVKKVLLDGNISIKHNRVIANKDIYNAVVKAYKNGIPVKWISDELEISSIIINETLKDAGVFEESTRMLLDEKTEAIIKAYENGMTIKQIKKEYRVSSDKIDEILYNAGVERRTSKFDPVINESLIETVKTMRENNVKAIEIQRKLGISHGTYYNILKRLGIQKKQVKEALFADTQLMEAVINYYNAGHTIREVKMKYDLSEDYIKEIFKKYNVKTRRGPISNKNKDYDVQEIIEAYKANMKWSEMTEKIGLSVSWMQELLKKNGVEVKRKKRMPNGNKKKTDEIVKLYESGLSIAKLSKMYSASQSTIRTFLQNSGVTIRGSHEAIIALSNRKYKRKTEDIINAYKNGMAIKDIETKYHTHLRTIYRMLEENGIEKRNLKA